MSDNTLKSFKIKENLTFGIDLGLASCGWAVIDRKDPNAPDILAAGSWCFNTPEEDKTRKPLNQNRREKRLLRRVIRRRRQRMQNIRKLFHQAGLFEFDPDISLGTEGTKLPNSKKIDPEDREILGHIGAYLRKESWDNLSPWILRTRGLDVRLSGPELAVALGHIAKHRGFKSNAKNGGKEDSSIKEAYNAVAKIIEDNPQIYRTFAEVLTQHPDYQAHKGRLRNRNEIYDCTPSRDLLLKEVKEIFDNQRDLGSKIATPTLEQNFIHIAFSQKGLL
ncbi:hypothetical protein FAI41_04160 [Acetobacteraceae bacterium]|nr:hypothetical protein FAI41_04160 [Acetobacteraceae bacterium]